MDIKPASLFRIVRTDSKRRRTTQWYLFCL